MAAFPPYVLGLVALALLVWIQVALYLHLRRPKSAGPKEDTEAHEASEKE